MADLDLTEARAAVSLVLCDPHGAGMSWHPSRQPTARNHQVTEQVLTVVAPLIEAAVREQVAQEIEVAMRAESAKPLTPASSGRWDGLAHAQGIARGRS